MYSFGTVFRMSRIRFLIILFSISISFIQAKTFFSDWGKDPVLDKRSDIIALYKLKNWEIAGIKAEQSQLPLFSDTADTITIINNFKYSRDSSITEVYFTSLGFHGLVTVYINGNLVSKQPNGSAPFRTKISLKYLKDKSENYIKIVLIKNSTFDNGFPVLTHLYTEPEYVGVTRPFYIELIKQTIFDDFKYSINKTSKGLILDYSYRINQNIISSLKNKSGLYFEEIFSDSSGKTISKRTNPANSKTGLLNNKITLKPNHLWSLDNPRFINLEITLKRYGREIRKEEKQFSFRNIEVNKNIIYFNFEKRLFHGLNYYENLASKKSSNIYSDIRKHLSLIKNDGFNAVRFYGHIPDERYLSIADTLGLFVFVDLPIRRFPDIAFKKDVLLENLKRTITSTINQFKSHPSFIALGIGQEILLSDPSTQKFYIILNGTTEKPIPLATYISPVPQNGFAKEMAADFYMLDLYAPLALKTDEILETMIPYSLAGKTGFSGDFEYLDHDNPNYNLQHRLLLKTDINSAFKNLKLQGGFIESFMDWRVKSPSHQNDGIENDLVQNGLYDTTLTKYSWAINSEQNIWKNADIETLAVEKKLKSSNIFSIVMFFGSLIFFFFYKRYPRFSENYKRAIKHPYGFYVDMRERRIIPVFNSFMLGVHNSLILSIFFASFIYYVNDSLLVQELLNVLISTPHIYTAYLLISKSEFLLIAVIFVLVFLHPIMIGVILKILGMISKNYVRFRQSMVIGLWSGAPFIFMLPFSFAAYHLLINDLFVIPLIIIVILFLLWANIRLINGIRVLVLAKFRVIFLVLLLSYTLPLVIFGFFFIPQPMWYDYLVTLINSSSLF